MMGDTEKKNRNKRAVGGHYERLAAGYLQDHGAVILERNYRCRSGEIDLIVRDGRYLVFVEVKYRRDAGKGYPEEAVDCYKQQHIFRAAQYYLYSNRYGENTPCRFDVVSIMGSEIRWIRDAFQM